MSPSPRIRLSLPVNLSPGGSAEPRLGGAVLAGPCSPGGSGWAESPSFAAPAQCLPRGVGYRHLSGSSLFFAERGGLPAPEARMRVSPRPGARTVPTDLQASWSGRFEADPAPQLPGLGPCPTLPEIPEPQGSLGRPLPPPASPTPAQAHEALEELGAPHNPMTSCPALQS